MTPTPPQDRPALPQPVAHASGDWLRAITETELALIPSADGRQERCRLLYRIPLVTQADAIACTAAKDAEIERLTRLVESVRALKSEIVTLSNARFERIAELEAALESIADYAKNTGNQVVFDMAAPPAQGGAV